MTESMHSPEEERLAEIADLRKGIKDLDDEINAIAPEDWNEKEEERDAIRERAIPLKERLYDLLSDNERVQELEAGLQEAIEEAEALELFDGELPILSIEEIMDDRFGRILTEEEMSDSLKAGIAALREKFHIES